MASTPKDVSNALFRGLLLVGLLGVAIAWFLIRSANMDEEEALFMRRVRRRKQEREEKLKKLEECKFQFF